MSVWLAIASAGVATYLTRALPLVIGTGRSAPAAVRRYLDALPMAIIAALAGPAIAAPGGTLTGGAEPLAAAVVAAVTAWRRNLLLGVLAGIATVAALRAAGG